MNAVESYERIAQDQEIRLHPRNRHLRALNRWLVEDDFNIDAFRKSTMPRSLAAARRESSFSHLGEYVTAEIKGIFEISNYLGGEYFLTADEIYVTGEHVLIQECKNAKDSKLPNEDDIKDGLFKLILFSNLERLTIDDVEVTFDIQLKLTGKGIEGSLRLPADPTVIVAFSFQNQLKASQQLLLEKLNQEALANPALVILIEGRHEAIV